MHMVLAIWLSSNLYAIEYIDEKCTHMGGKSVVRSGTWKRYVTLVVHTAPRIDLELCMKQRRRSRWWRLLLR